jgi:hypothetical protein
VLKARVRVTAMDQAAVRRALLRAIVETLQSDGIQLANKALEAPKL